MAMTKKEKDQIEALTSKIRLLGALRWTSAVETDVAIPSGNGIVNGWLPNAYTPKVEKSCTSSVHHSFGNWDKTTTQHPKSLYSTKLMALKACRHLVELESAEKLAKIDIMIEEEESNGTN